MAVNGRALGFCSGLNLGDGAVEVVRCRPRDGDWPAPVLGEDAFVVDTLKLPLEFPKERPASWINWTGDGWIDEKSQPVEGPIPEILVENTP